LCDSTKMRRIHTYLTRKCNLENEVGGTHIRMRQRERERERDRIDIYRCISICIESDRNIEISVHMHACVYMCIFMRISGPVAVEM